NWPALRERPDDILPLAEYFIERYAPQQGYRLSESARKQLLAYQWPGNVRELDNVIQRSLIMARGLHIQAVDLMLP
ncbi:AAA-type ATPase lid domain-containing protein, partial [Aeromonas hydrophila]